MKRFACLWLACLLAAFWAAPVRAQEEEEVARYRMLVIPLDTIKMEAYDVDAWWDPLDPVHDAVMKKAEMREYRCFSQGQGGSFIEFAFPYPFWLLSPYEPVTVALQIMIPRNPYDPEMAVDKVSVFDAEDFEPLWFSIDTGKEEVGNVGVYREKDAGAHPETQPVWYWTRPIPTTFYFFLPWDAFSHVYLSLGKDNPDGSRRAPDVPIVFSAKAEQGGKVVAVSYEHLMFSMAREMRTRGIREKEIKSLGNKASLFDDDDDDEEEENAPGKVPPVIDTIPRRGPVGVISAAIDTNQRREPVPGYTHLHKYAFRTLSSDITEERIPIYNSYPDLLVWASETDTLTFRHLSKGEYKCDSTMAYTSEIELITLLQQMREEGRFLNESVEARLDYRREEDGPALEEDGSIRLRAHVELLDQRIVDYRVRYKVRKTVEAYCPDCGKTFGVMTHSYYFFSRDNAEKFRNK